MLAIMALRFFVLLLSVLRDFRVKTTALLLCGGLASPVSGPLHLHFTYLYVRIVPSNKFSLSRFPPSSFDQDAIENRNTQQWYDRDGRFAPR